MTADWLNIAHECLTEAADNLRHANSAADPVAGLFTLALIERAVMLERDVLALAQAIAARESA